MLISLKTRLNNFSLKHPHLFLFITIVLSGFLLTVVFTWPMIFKLHVFYSDESDYTLIGWILWYNQLSFTTGRIFSSSNYFNAFQFYPWPFSLAFSENLFLPSLLFAPLYWITHQIVLSVNIYTFSTFILTFVSSFYVFKKILRDILAAIIASIIFSFNPLTAAHFPGHTHLLGKFFIPLLFLNSINFFIRPTFKNAFLFGLFFTLNSLTSITFLIISIPTLLFTFIPFLVSNLFQKKWEYFKKIFLSSLICIIFLPLFFHFIIPYQKFSQQENAQRGVDESIFFSAQPIDWILPFPESLMYKNIVSHFDHNRIGFPKINYSEHTLGLNILPLLLFIIGLIYINKQKVITSKNYLISIILIAIGTFIFTFGPIIDGLKSPYYYYNFMTGLLNGIRVPTRFQFFFYIPFSIIAGLGFLSLSKYLSIKKIHVFLICLFIITLEGFNNWNFISDTSSLTDNPPLFNEYRNFTFLQESTTLHLPIYTENFERQIYYLNLATLHSEKLMNGYSGYFPTDWIEFISNIESNLDDTTLKKLSALKLNYLIFHKDRLDPNFIIDLKNKNPLIDKLIYFEDQNYLILNINSPLLASKKCFLNKDIHLSLIPKTATFGLTPTYFNQVKIKNQGDCYFTNLLNNRYLDTSFFINGKFYPMNLKMPMVIGPKEEILLK